MEKLPYLLVGYGLSLCLIGIYMMAYFTMHPAQGRAADAVVCTSFKPVCKALGR
jgi:hypothetical protein